MISEYRYLLDEKFDIDNINIPFFKSKITEYYTYISRCKSIKYQMKNNDFFKVVIVHNNENIKKISKEKFNKNIEKSLSKFISKNVYDFNNNFKIILYGDKLKGLKILISKNKKVIKEFLPYIQEDISCKKRFRDINIALYGSPFDDEKNIHNLLKKIKNMENIEMKNIIKKDMAIDSAVRVKLYELFIKIEKSRFDILKKGSNKASDISLYRKNLITAVNILQEYNYCFDKELVDKVEENLKYILKKTDIDSELSSIKSNLLRYQKCLNSDEFLRFLKEKDQEITTEVESFSYFIQTREYSIIMRQLEMLIKESSIELAEENEENTTIKNALKKSIKKAYKKLMKSIKKYIDCDDEKSYQKIYKKMQKLKILNKEFGFLNEDEVFYKRKKNLSSIDKNLTELLHNMKNIDIANSTIKDADEVECLVRKFEKQKDKSLNKLKKNIKKLKKAKKFFIS